MEQLLYTVTSLAEPNDEVPGFRVQVYLSDQWKDYVCKTQILLVGQGKQTWSPYSNSSSWYHTDSLTDAKYEASTMLNKAYDDFIVAKEEYYKEQTQR